MYCIEVTCDDASAASGFAQYASDHLHLEHAPELRVEGVKVDIEKMQDCARCGWGGDIHAQRISAIPAGQLSVEDTVEHH